MIRKPFPTIVWCLAVVLSLTGAAALAAKSGMKKPRAPVVFGPDATSGKLPEGMTLDGPTWTMTTPTHRVRLRQLDEEERRRYVQNNTGSTADPFTQRPDRPRGFLTFLLLIENLNDEGLIFQPQNCWLKTTHNKIEYPLDHARIRSVYTLLEQEFPPAYEKAAGALLEGEKRLLAGDSVHGLLVYRSPHERMKRFNVDVSVTLSDGKLSSFSAPYRALKKDEENP